jgi:predicted Ser/Thr protein kinase
VVYIKNYSDYNLKQLQFIGEGIHGKVYKIDSERCIKIFKKSSFFEKELETLQMAQSNNHFPKLLAWGKKYIVREYIDGIELDQYLKKNSLGIELSKKIIDLYEVLGKLGFKRQDAVLFHILVTEGGELRMIDTARVMKECTKYPRLIIDGLNDLGLKHEFMNHTKLLRPDLYDLWFKNDR